MTMTYYTNNKKYAPLKFVLPDDCKSYTLAQMQNNLGFTVFSNDIGIKNKSEIRTPTIYICRNEGILRINRYTFVKVTIPNELKGMLHYCSDIEVVICKDDDFSNYTSIYPQIKRVFRFPNFLDYKEEMHSENDRIPFNMDDDDDINDDDINDDEINDDDQDDDEPDFGDISWAKQVLADLDDDVLDNDDLDLFLPDDYPADISEGLKDPSHKFFYDWVKNTSSRIIYHYKDKVNDFLMVYYSGHCYLVSFFDDKQGNMWIADEELHADFKNPFWASESGIEVSPMFAIGKAAAFLKRKAHIEATPVTILDDNISISNLDEMLSKWDSLGLFICHRGVNDDDLPPFDWLMENVNPEPQQSPNAIKEMWKALATISQFHLEQ